MMSEKLRALIINPQTDKIVGTAWNNSLAHQIPNGKLPDYYKVKDDLLELFEQIFSKN